MVSIGLAAERYRRDIVRLAALTGMRLDAEGDDPAVVAAAIAPLQSALPPSVNGSTPHGGAPASARSGSNR